jgi:hypothetical protein
MQLESQSFLGQRWVVRAGFVAALVVLATALAYSQKNSNADDAFVTDPALRAYLERSSYQHGSLHGYEDGYQFGDLDFHLQRPDPEFKKVKEFRSATRGYADGDRDEYRAGYQHGYLLGYRDGAGGRPFAALERLEAAAEEKPVILADAEPAGEEPDQIELAAFAPPSKPLKVPMDAIFLAQEISVQPPADAPASKDSALARIMNNLRSTFMPGLITPQALVQASPR